MADQNQSSWVEVDTVEINGIMETTSHMRVMGGFLYRVSTSWQKNAGTPGGRAEALTFVPTPEKEKELRPQVRRRPSERSPSSWRHVDVQGSNSWPLSGSLRRREARSIPRLPSSVM